MTAPDTFPLNAPELGLLGGGLNAGIPLDGLPFDRSPYVGTAADCRPYGFGGCE